MSKKKPILDILGDFFKETLFNKSIDEILPKKVYIYQDEEKEKVRVSTKKHNKLRLIGECYIDEVQENVTSFSELLGYKNRPVSRYSLENTNFKGPKTEKQLEASRRSYRGSIKNPKVGITWGRMAKEFPEFYSSIMKRVAVILKEQGHFERIGKLGAEATISKFRKEGRLHAHMKYMTECISEETRKKMTEAFIKAGKEYSQTPEARERCRIMGIKYGSSNGKKNIHNILESPKRKAWCSSGGLGGGAKKAIEMGTHNFLSQSPNKKLVLCPDGMVSSAPSAVLYCNAKNLAVDKIVSMPENYLYDLDSKILDVLKDKGEVGFIQIQKEISAYPLHLVKNRVNLFLKNKTVNAVGNTVNRKFYLV